MDDKQTHDGSSEFPPLTPEEIIEHKKLEKDLSKLDKTIPKLKTKDKSARQRIKECEIIDNFLSQYLESYILLGFNTAGNEFLLKHAETPLDFRALNDLITEYFSTDENLHLEKNNEKD